MNKPDYIFETSWEVCNRVGGIYAVLSTRAASMQAEHTDKVIFFGPDFGAHSDTWFREDKSVLQGWTASSVTYKNIDIPIRIGRWAVPGNPIAILLRSEAMAAYKDAVYAWAWEKFGVQSHAAYGDYDESCLFGYAAGIVMGNIYRWLETQNKDIQVCMHANEWQTAFTIFYLRDYCPQIATLFTTHATGIGRSIAGNGKPLYDYFAGYNGDQMAAELNMVSKHSVEKQAAHWSDCFTTVSEITARECKQLLDKPVDIVTPNGFEPDFVPRGKSFTTRRVAARQALRKVAGDQLGGIVPEDAVLICISGRQEWKNKGINVFLSAMDNLAQRLYHAGSSQQFVAFVTIPYLDRPFVRNGQVSIVFVPHYLDGKDPLFGMTYYDLLIGMDITVFPSYYEPWGYTPLESVAFHVPTITTSLAGFGLWAQEQSMPSPAPVQVIDRNDSNYGQVVDKIAQQLFDFAHYTDEQRENMRKAAHAVSKKAEWKHFFKYYRKAYHIAIEKCKRRNK